MASEQVGTSFLAVLVFCLGTALAPLGCSASDDYALVPQQATNERPALPETPDEVVRQLRACVREHARASGGNFAIDFDVDVTREGHAQDARITSSNLRDAQLEQCMLQALRTMTVSPEILVPSSAEPISMSPRSRGLTGIAIPHPGIVLAGFLVVYGISVMIQITLHVVLSSSTAPTIPVPMAATTTTTAPTATTTTTAPPIVLPRRFPGQTCDDKRLDELETAKRNACQGFPGTTCRQRTDKEKAQAPVYPCSLLMMRIAAVEICVAARQKIQDECFKGSPEPGHEQQIDDLTRGIALCEALKAVNCAPGHPMSGL